MQTENGWKPQKQQAIGFSARIRRAMQSTKKRLKIGAAEGWLPGVDSNHGSRLQRPLSYH